MLWCMLMVVAPVCATSVDDATAKLAVDLQNQYKQKSVLKIGIADLVTPGNAQSGFGDYLTESFGDAFNAAGSKFKVIEQQSVSAVFFKKKVQLNKPYDNGTLNAVTKGIFDVTQEAVSGYLYGQIKDMGDEIKITVKLIDAISGSEIALASVKFPSDETTDKLLNKPVRASKLPKTDTVVVVKEHVVEKVIEKPVSAAQETEAVQSGAGFRIGSFSVSLKNCSYSGTSLVVSCMVTNTDELTRELTLRSVRMVDPDGIVYSCNKIVIGNDVGGVYTTSRIIGNVPVQASITFDDVTPGLVKIKALQINAQGQEFVLRDIAINKN